MVVCFIASEGGGKPRSHFPQTAAVSIQLPFPENPFARAAPGA
jgi:hypothetical protein